MEHRHFYKWKPEVADHRDYSFSLKMKASVVPTFVEPLAENNQVENQGAVGSCTGNASTTALEISLNSPIQYSRLMAYYNGRWLEKNTKNDDGAQIRDVIKGIQKFGVAEETFWPYVPEKFAKKPSIAAYKDARKVLPLIDRYERLTSLNEIKVALASNLAVVFGFAVPDYFSGPEMEKSEWSIRMPTPTDQMVGGHAVACIGYETRPEKCSEPFMWVRNSWGKEWGINGNFKMPFTWFTSPLRLTDDMWVIHAKKRTE